MDPRYDIHSWSRLYREDRLAEAEERTLVQRLRVRTTPGKDGHRQGKGVLSMRRIALVVVVAAIMAMLIAFSAPAFASHEHYLLTPGTCVEDIASGQTAKGPDEGGYHKFHENVHKGTSDDPATPGGFAFQNPHNRVSVDKGSCPSE